MWFGVNGVDWDFFLELYSGVYISVMNCAGNNAAMFVTSCGSVLLSGN